MLQQQLFRLSTNYHQPLLSGKLILYLSIYITKYIHNNMPPQIKRLLPLFAIFIALFLLIRYFLIPDSFGKYGHYRANSIWENAAYPLFYAGAASCADCHDDVAAAIDTDLHRHIRCETCHGPGIGHVNYPDSIPVARPAGRDFCGLCHAKNPARNSQVVKQVDLTEHNPAYECIDCHNPHLPWEMKDL